MAKILVIDDDQSIRETLQDMLEMQGYQIVTAPEGKTGVIKALHETPDLIICDVMMPELDGFGVLSSVRASQSISNTPFLFLTGQSDHHDIREGMNLGADDYLMKPFAHQDLINSVETRLKRREISRQEIDKQLNKIQNIASHTAVHELNTPMNGIMGGLELLLSSWDNFAPNEIKQMLRMIDSSSKRLYRTLNNNLIFSFLENLNYSDSRHRHYTSGLTEECRYPVMEVIEQVVRNHQRSSDLSVRIENAELHINYKNLQKIVEEITDNACKFSFSGQQIFIDGRRNGDQYVFFFKDEGRGMRKEHIDRIAPYTQFDREKYEQQGNGLGLYIARKLSELNRGRFHIDSAPGYGTEVTVVFPLTPPE